MEIHPHPTYYVIEAGIGWAGVGSVLDGSPVFTLFVTGKCGLYSTTRNDELLTRANEVFLARFVLSACLPVSKPTKK